MRPSWQGIARRDPSLRRLGCKLLRAVGSVLRRGLNRDPADNFCTAARARLDPDIAAMQLHKVLHQRQAKASAALVAAHVHAMTDVTGFGLFGHLRNICVASGCGALIWRDHVPLLPGALALSGAGHRSSLFAENRAQWHGTEADPLTDLLFDPQTAGGLLATVPGDPSQVMERLKLAGVEVWHIGTMTDRVGQIDIS